ncbi:MAG: hypothetical protein HRT61_18875, partial [Ekhidna sp.]|nr:hypothetical protein [Ekhidna sp.]
MSQDDNDLISLESYFFQIEDATDFRFFYKKEWIEGVKVKNKLTKQPFTYELLKQVLARTAIDFF